MYCNSWVPSSFLRYNLNLSPTSHLHKGGADHLKLSKYQVQPGDLVDSSSLCCGPGPPTAAPLTLNSSAVRACSSTRVLWHANASWRHRRCRRMSHGVVFQGLREVDNVRYRTWQLYSIVQENSSFAGEEQVDKNKKANRYACAVCTDGRMDSRIDWTHSTLHNMSAQRELLDILAVQDKDECFPDHCCNPWKLPWRGWQRKERVQVIWEICLLSRSSQTNLTMRPQPRWMNE